MCQFKRVEDGILIGPGNVSGSFDVCGGVNRIPAGTPRQSVIPANSILVLAPKVGPGRRPSERQSNRIPQSLCHRLEAGQHRVDAGCGDSVDGVCAELRREGKGLAMALSSVSVVTNALRLNRVRL